MRMSESVVLHARAAYPGIGRPVIEQATLVVVDGVIQAIGPRGEFGVPDGAKVYDFSDQYLLPGLIDTHVHLTMPGDGQAADQFVQVRNDMELLLAAERNAERSLAAGVTTLRDVGSRGRTVMLLRDAIARGEAIGPRLVVSGPPITITGGHCHYMGGEADGVDGVRQMARSIIKSGADLVKVMGSGGGTPNVNHGHPSFSVAEMAAAAEEAHRFGRRITVHATCSEAIEICLEAGVDMLEHAAMWTTGSHNRVHQYRTDLAERIVAQGVWVCPTLQASYGVIKQLRQRQEQGTFTAEERAQLDRRLGLFENTMDVFRRMWELGVRQVAGTDAGWDINPFGEEYVTGLELAAQGGMPTWAVIEHATSLAAEAIGLGGKVGALQAGELADLLLVPGDPAVDLQVLRRPSAVFKEGRLVARNGALVHEGAWQ